MKFFLPHAHDSSQERKIYGDIREFLTGELGAVLADRKIFGLTYSREDQEYRVEVGKTHPAIGEIVEAILYDEGMGIYYLCTRNHGVVRGHPIMVNIAHVESEVLFDH
jgi:hypothetical protein